MMSETIQAAARYAQKPKEKDNTLMYLGIGGAAALGLVLFLRRRA
jgi:LPXTG-motif cell wall-anchored protein